MISSDYAVMQKSLDALWLRLNVISNNVANVDTPGYIAKKVEFEDILQSKILNRNIKETKEEIVNTTAFVEEDNSATVRKDGNNVDIDAQNIELARTQIQYEYMTKMMSNSISKLRYAINEGRR